MLKQIMFPYSIWLLWILLAWIILIETFLSFQWAKYFCMSSISYWNLRSGHSLTVIWSHNWPSPNTCFKDRNRKRNYVQFINSYNNTGRSINNTQSIWMLFQHPNMTLMASILWLPIYKKEKHNYNRYLDLNETF